MKLFNMFTEIDFPRQLFRMIDENLKNKKFNWLLFAI